MPQILVVTNTPESADEVVLYQERIAPPDLESDHFSAQLIERLGWALVDADAAEHSSEARATETPAGTTGEQPPQFAPPAAVHPPR